eukprot:COSAG04_NODE_18976_length_428_cov_0.513678_1_plen_58_part_10
MFFTASATTGSYTRPYTLPLHDPPPITTAKKGITTDNRPGHQKGEGGWAHPAAAAAAA